MRNLSLVTVGLALTFAVDVALAEVVTYTITQGKSSLTAQGQLAGSNSSAQSAGSNLTSYSGTIQADRIGSTIQFLDGGAMQAANTGNYEPESGGTPGTDPANYGLESNTIVGPAVAAVRSLRLDLNSGVLNIAGSGEFASNFNTVVADGVIDWNTGLSFDQEDLFGRSSGNTAGTASRVSSDGVTETLTLRFNINYGYSTLTTSDSNLNLVGTIVATRIIPEPTWLSLLGLALLLRRHRFT